MNKEKAYFAAGCFWGIEEAFRNTESVLETTAGFMGGNVDNPSYKQVCGGSTGHAETVEVVYDPKVITFSDFLNKFWEVHDPTQLNRQGLDIGSQYRSVIFYTNEDQKRLALESKEKMEKLDKYKNKIVTDIKKASDFYKAEEYHQKYKAKQKEKYYMNNNSNQKEELWKDKLTKEEYKALREAATEPAFTGKYWDSDNKGVYRCKACGNKLFSSDVKFKSGSGWPSFTEPLEKGNVELKEDRSHGMVRTEVICGQCKSHLGHVFDNGPTETGKRYCVNSICLDLESE